MVAGALLVRPGAFLRSTGPAVGVVEGECHRSGPRFFHLPSGCAGGVANDGNSPGCAGGNDCPFITLPAQNRHLSDDWIMKIIQISDSLISACVNWKSDAQKSASGNHDFHLETIVDFMDHEIDLICMKSTTPPT